MNKKRIAAICGVVLLLLLYVATFVFAILDFDGAEHLFAASLLATIGVPILIWIYVWLIKTVQDKRKEN